jgi:hypothetical protein
MSSEPVRTNRRSRPRLRHPAEVPLFIFMVVLNLIIVAAILEAAAVLPFLPERLQDSGWAVAIRGALISLLLFIPALMVVRETQRARPGAPPSSCQSASTPSCTRPPRTSPTLWGCGDARRSSSPTATGP